MKKLIYILLFTTKLFSQNNDTVFIFGCEDNWDNIKKYKNEIELKIDSIISNDNVLIRYNNVEKTLCFTIDNFGEVRNIFFKENIGFDFKTDSTIFVTLGKLKFENAAVFNPCTKKKYTLNFTLPIKIKNNE